MEVSLEVIKYFRLVRIETFEDFISSKAAKIEVGV